MDYDLERAYGDGSTCDTGDAKRRADGYPAGPALVCRCGGGGQRAEAGYRRAAERPQAFIVDAAADVAVPVDTAWDVLTDFDHMTSILGNLTASRIIARNGNIWQVKQEGVARYGPFSYSFESVREIRLEPMKRIVSKTREEEEQYFEPEQKLRLVETAVQSRLYELLTREGAPAGEGKISAELNQLVTFITLDRLVGALGADAAKSSSLLESQIRGWLEAHGWTYGRESTGQRRRGYKQPAVWPPRIDEDESLISDTRRTQAVMNEGNDDEPF